MSATVTNAPATEKQLAYIADLIYRHYRTYRQTVESIERTTRDLDAPESRHDKRRHDAAALLAELWQTVTLPTARLTQQQASTVIERLRRATAFADVVGDWLDEPKMARNYGVAEFIDARRDAIERALKAA